MAKVVELEQKIARIAMVPQFGDLLEDHIRVHRALKKLTSGEARKVVGAVRDEYGFHTQKKIG